MSQSWINGNVSMTEEKMVRAMMNENSVLSKKACELQCGDRFVYFTNVGPAYVGSNANRMVRIACPIERIDTLSNQRLRFTLANDKVIERKFEDKVICMDPFIEEGEA